MSSAWSGEGLVLSTRRHGESGAVVELFTAAHGRVGGYVHGGGGRKMTPVLQVGNLVRVDWKARLSDQLGHFSPIELIEPNAARILHDAAALAALSAAAGLIRKATAERQAYPGLFDALSVLVTALETPDLLGPIYTRFELGLLAALGFGIDLGACAVTGGNDDLAYVSPRSGRAASRSAGEAYADKLLRLAPFLVAPDAHIAPGDVADAFALSGFFLEKRVFDPLGEGLPEPRRRLIELLGHSGRL
jgi:DNA repair protein RecO (recombination protein O)